MANSQSKVAPEKESKDKNDKAKDRKTKDGKALVGRVKKVIKKSRRKLSEEKFEKQLQRTIAFLEKLQSKIADAQPQEAVDVKAEKNGKPKKAKSNGKADVGKIRVRAARQRVVKPVKTA